jgi:hypothetical protein
MDLMKRKLPVETDRARAATANRDLRKLVSTGVLRADLFFRLNGITMTLPPLRKRPDDVHPLAMHFVERAARKLGKPPPRLGEEAAQALAAHTWPGNVRELRNVIERAVVLCQSDQLRLPDLLLHEEPEFPGAATAAALAPVPGQAGEEITVRMPAPPPDVVEAPELRGKMEEFERAQIVEALAKTRGNRPARPSFWASPVGRSSRRSFAMESSGRGRRRLGLPRETTARSTDLWRKRQNAPGCGRPGHLQTVPRVSPAAGVPMRLGIVRWTSLAAVVVVARAVRRWGSQ